MARRKEEGEMGEPENTQAGPPAPDPALRRLERLVGTWEFTGRTVGSEVDNVFGRNTFEWLPRGFFLLQRIDIEFVGQEVAGIEVIGYDPETDSFPSTVYSNFSPTPLPYRYEVDDDQLKIPCRTIRSTRRSPPPSVRTGGASLGLATEPGCRRDGQRPVRPHRTRVE